MKQNNHGGSTSTRSTAGTARLQRMLSLWNLVIIGMVMVQPTAPMGIYGVISNKAHGHVVTTILIAMVAMLFTAVSYGQMAKVYPSAGSAYTYVGQELHPALGYLVGWSMVMDYILGPLICVAFCAKATANILPGQSYYLWILIFATVFTWLNLRGIKTSARVNEVLCGGMVVVIIVFFGCVIRSLWGIHHNTAFFANPFYEPVTFHWSSILSGTSVAVLTYIGFDGISTLSEEAQSPQRNILVATILVCTITGLLSGLEVYAAQLVWESKQFPSGQIESAFASVSRQVGGAVLFQIINFTLLVANMGSGMGSQLAAGRLLYSMGRSNALPNSFFGTIDPKRYVPRNNVVTVGVLAFAGAGILEFFAVRLGGGAYEIGAQALNFGAFIGFMGVNASFFAHLWRNPTTRHLTNLAPPALGFLICGLVWIHLSHIALLLGTGWVTAGIAYGAFRTRGFRSRLGCFDAPTEETPPGESLS